MSIIFQLSHNGQLTSLYQEAKIVLANYQGVGTTSGLHEQPC